MILGDFIKELKHNTVKIKIINDDTNEDIFKGTLGELKNNIHYQNEWCKMKIYEIAPYYDDNFKIKIDFIIFS